MSICGKVLASGESWESRSKKLQKNREDLWPPLHELLRGAEKQRGTRFGFGGHEFLATTLHSRVQSRTFWQTASSARIRPKNSSFNSALSYRLIHWPGLFFNLCHRVVREINRTRTMLHSSDGTRFVFRDRGLIYRRDRRRQCNAVTTGSNETKREIERSLPIFLSTWTTSFVPTNR